MNAWALVVLRIFLTQWPIESFCQEDGTVLVLFNDHNINYLQSENL